MTSMTVSNAGGRVRVPELPNLSAPQTGDRVLGVQGSVVGLFPAGAFSNGSGAGTPSPDLSDYATTTALTQAVNDLRGRITGVANSIPVMPNLSEYAKKSDVPDTSQFVTAQQVGQQITQAINELPIPSIAGLAKQSDLNAETSARQAGDASLSQKIEQVRASIPTAPDLSGYAKQSDLTAETTARQQGDATLAQRVDDVEQKIASLPSTAPATPSSGGLAAGTIAYFATTTPPENWRVRDGSAFPMDVYPELAKLYPSGVLPNDCGLFIRGYDPNGTNDIDGPTRGFASYQEGSAAAAASGVGGRVGIPVFQPGDLQPGGFDAPNADHYPSKPNVSNPFQSSYFDLHTPSPNNPWGVLGVTRPKNRNYLPIIYAGQPAK